MATPLTILLRILTLLTLFSPFLLLPFPFSSLFFLPPLLSSLPLLSSSLLCLLRLGIWQAHLCQGRWADAEAPHRAVGHEHTHASCASCVVWHWQVDGGMDLLRDSDSKGLELEAEGSRFTVLRDVQGLWVACSSCDAQVQAIRS